MLRCAPAAISSAPGGGVLLYGDGRNSIFDHWLWKGAGWTQLPPPPLQWASSFSPVVAFRADVGRIFIDLQNEIVEWDGTQWLGPFASASEPRQIGASLLGLPGAVVLSLAPLAPLAPRMLSIVTETPAEAQAYGSGCALGRAPSLSLRGALGPEHPPGELLAVTGVPQTPVLFGFGTASLNLPLGSGCALLVGGLSGSLVAATDGIGDASLLLAVPPQRVLLGLQLYCQAAVLDPTGGPLQGVSLSSGLRLRLGR